MDKSNIELMNVLRHKHTLETLCIDKEAPVCIRIWMEYL